MVGTGSVGGAEGTTDGGTAGVTDDTCAAKNCLSNNFNSLSVVNTGNKVDAGLFVTIGEGVPAATVGSGRCPRETRY